MNVMIRENCGKQIQAAVCDVVGVLAATTQIHRFDAKPLGVDEVFEGLVEEPPAQLGALPQLRAAE